VSYMVTIKQDGASVNDTLAECEMQTLKDVHGLISLAMLAHDKPLHPNLKQVAKIWIEVLEDGSDKALVASASSNWKLLDA
jgi:hypothetical protein